MIEPVVNLGQSQFQDTFFVAQAQFTPYRQLRQIELELRQIEDGLKRSSLMCRRLQLKIEKLDKNDPEQALDIEECEWDLQQQVQMVADSEARRANFLAMKQQLLEGVPQEYWDRGYENCELDHWVQVIAHDMAVMRLTGQINPTTMKQLAMLPEGAVQHVLQLTNEKALRLGSPETKSITAEIKTLGTEGEPEPEVRSLQAPT